MRGEEMLMEEELYLRRQSKAEVTFGPTSCRAKLGKKVLWSLEEETSCIKDLLARVTNLDGLVGKGQRSKLGFL
ncbi:hypothetical protein CLOM_g15413 [Closterium sp. NIES-68]|nr:hypothetical protein CLOM_g15413 [Closterium sp. NIES-68]